MPGETRGTARASMRRKAMIRMTTVSLAAESEIATAICQAQAGDSVAFDYLVRHYQRLVYRICLRIVGRHELAEDSTQETFLAAWRNISTIKAHSFRSWLCTVATNTSRTEMRRRRRRPETDLVEADAIEGDDTPLDLQCIHRDLRLSIEDCLEKIPASRREALVLSHFVGLDYRTIAHITGVSTGTVKSRTFRGRRELASLLLRVQKQSTEPMDSAVCRSKDWGR